MRAPSNVWAAFEATVRSAQGRPAVLVDSECLTFADWHVRSHAYAATYRARGLSRLGRVLLWTDTSPEMACALVGAWAAGGLPVVIDPRSGATHFEHAVATASPDVIAADSPQAVPRSDAAAALVTPLDVTENDASPRTPAPLLATDPASILFTSGSTGRPKGVTQSHGNLLRGCLTVNGYLGTSEHDRILCTVPWSFDYGYGQLLTAAVTGATLVLPTASSPIEMCEAIERHRPTVLAGVPSVFTYLLRGVSPFRTIDLSSITTVTNTGGTIPAPILDELFGLLPDARFFLNYGLTETYRTSYLDPTLARVRPTSIGKAIPGADVIVVRDDGSLAGQGEVGEIVHRGDYVCLGYWNDPEATAKALRPDPLAPAGSPGAPSVMFTGDYGYLDEEGYLYFAGRRDHQLKSMGVRVSPSDVEDLLCRSELVKEAAVVGRKHEMLGDEVCAFVVPVDHVQNVAFEVGRYARRAMSPYMVPRRIFAVGALERTPNGKVDYPALRRIAADDAANARRGGA